jgi:hypothetical protein
LAPTPNSHSTAAAVDSAGRLSAVGFQPSALPVPEVIGPES